MTTTIRLYSDFVCPFCFIAERGSLERLQEQYDVDVEWRGFELHPSTPAGGMPITRLFPASQVPAMRKQMLGFAGQFGVTDMQFQEHISNTRKAMALMELARDKDVVHQLRSALMDAYWRHGVNLEDDAQLKTLAQSVGLDGDEALAATRNTAYLQRVDRMQAEAKSMGVTGIPTFFIGERAVVGCQPYEVLEAAVKKAGAQLRQ